MDLINLMPRPKTSLRADWTPVSARISPDLKNRLIKKNPNNGDFSKLIRALLQKYADGKIIGLKLEV